MRPQMMQRTDEREKEREKKRDKELCKIQQ